MLVIPSSLKEEHKEIIGSLREFVNLPAQTGKAIRELLDVLEPHFEKEEKLVMPVLGGKSELVLGDLVTHLREIAVSQEALLQEYGKMLEEHSKIRKSIVKAQKIAPRRAFFSFSHHARVEEEVSEPPALLAGTVAKCLMQSVGQKVGIL